MNVSLFDYPGQHVRKHAPAGYAEYQEFKEWLRDEFTFRCAYCLERERWYPSSKAGMSTDHIVARMKDKDLEVEYGNTVYACLRCNSAKRENELIDPTATAFSDHLEMAPDGLMHPKTVQGYKLIHLLHLNEDDPLRTRRTKMGILKLKGRYPQDADVDELYLDAFGYPTVLPDLVNKVPPGGNPLHANTADCYFERRKRGQITEASVY